MEKHFDAKIYQARNHQHQLNNCPINYHDGYYLYCYMVYRQT
jgi:hypothetical protein